MNERNDQLVEDYLSHVSRATVGLPPAQRDELISDLREHIETGRAEFDPETEAQVRELLERLGDPTFIAQAAAEDSGPAPAGATAPQRSGRRRVAIIVAVVAVVLLLALCAGFLFFAQSSDGGSAM